MPGDGMKNLQLDTFSLKTKRLVLTPPVLDDAEAEAMLDYQKRSR